MRNNRKYDGNNGDKLPTLPNVSPDFHGIRWHRVVILGAWIGLVQGCTTTPTAPGPDVCTLQECPCTISDPTPHCVRLDGCRGDRDCPTGTICLPAADIESPLVYPLDTCRTDAIPTRCRIANQSFERALIDGFRVNAFLLDPIVDTNAFSLSPPPEARFVACALFGCRPDIAFTDRTDVAGNPIAEIVNYDQCSLSGAPQTFTIVQQSSMEAVSFAFTPSVNTPNTSTGLCPDVFASLPVDQRPLRQLGTQQRQLTQLGVGCWAYDDTSLIAATPIVAVPTDQIASLSNIDSVLADCQNDSGDPSGKPGKSCLLAGGDLPLIDAPQFGSCFATHCRPRCVTAADCPEQAVTKDCMQPISTCIHDSPTVGLPSFVGICDYDCQRDEIDGGFGGGG